MPIADYTPAVADVASFLRARTKTVGGQEAGTFNPEASPEQDQTRPTAEQVESLIQDALNDDIIPAFGPDVPDAPVVADGNQDPDLYRKAVARLTALGAALAVELTYFPEQVATNRSPYAQLLALYTARMKRMIELVAEAQGGDAADAGESVASGATGYPSGGGFPETAIGMEFPW